MGVDVWSWEGGAEAELLSSRNGAALLIDMSGLVGQKLLLIKQVDINSIYFCKSHPIFTLQESSLHFIFCVVYCQF